MDCNRIPNTKCLVCSTAIYRRPSWLTKTNGRAFCSVNCHGEYLKITHPCPVCGKAILASGNKRTCSRACANKRRIGNKYKLNPPRLDKVVNERALKLRLISSGKNKCERCKYSKLEILQVHHKDRNRQHNDMDNLELICPNCHYEEHYLENSWLKTYDISGFQTKLRIAQMKQ